VALAEVDGEEEVPGALDQNEMGADDLPTPAGVDAVAAAKGGDN